MSPTLVTGNLGWGDDDLTFDSTRPAAARGAGFRHLLELVELQDEGHPVFRIICPGSGLDGCPELDDPDDVPGYCVVADQYGNIGREIIRGRAYGSGPWPIGVTWEGYGEGAEMYVDLIEEETEPVLPVHWVVSA